MVVDTIDEENELPLIIELPKTLLVQGLEMKVQGEVNPETVAFDTAGFVWHDEAICLDLSFADKGGTRLATVYIDPVINAEQSIFLSVQIEVGDYITSWSFAKNSSEPSIPQDRLQELFPRIYEMCKDSEDAMAELAEVAEHMDHVEEENEHLRQEHSPS